MAIVLNQEEKGLLEYTNEAIELMETEGLDNPSLQTMIQKHWIQPFEALGRFANQIQSVDSTLVELFQQVIDGREILRRHIELEYFGPYLDREEDLRVNYKLYFNTVTGEFTTEPQPLETVLLYEDNDFALSNHTTRSLGLGKLVYQFMLDLSNDSKRAVEEEALRRILRRAKNALKRDMIQDIQSASDPEGNLQRLFEGEILEVDLSPQQGQDAFYYSSYLINFYRHYRFTQESEEATLYLMEENLQNVVQWLDGKCGMLDTVIRRIRGMGNYVDGALLSRLVELFIEQWGVEGAIDWFFYAEMNDGKRLLRSIQNPSITHRYLIEALPDNAFERMFKIYIQTATKRTVDFGLVTSDREKYMLSLRVFLEDERSKPLLEKWGGFYTDVDYCCDFPILYRPNYELEDFLRGNTERGGSITKPTVYIDDGLYDDIGVLVESMERVSSDALEIRRTQWDWKGQYQVLQPVSKLEKQIEGLDITLHDFILGDFVYVPALSTDGVVTLNMDVEEKAF